MRGWIWAALLAMGCGPDEQGDGGKGGGAGSAGMIGVAGNVSAGGNVGAGGSVSSAGNAGAGGSAQGGSVGSGGGGGGAGGLSCDQEWSVYESLVLPARRCDPAAAEPQCDIDVVLYNRCGCSIPANESSSEYLEAKRRGVKYYERCGWPEDCPCPATLNAACLPDGSDYVCQYD